MRHLLLALAILAGCIDDEDPEREPPRLDPPEMVEEGLARFPGPVMEFAALPPASAPSTLRAVTVRLHYDGTREEAPQIRCLMVRRLALVTVDGVEAEAVDRGHSREVWTPDLIYSVCVPPKFTAYLPVSTTGATKVRLADASFDQTYDVTIPSS